MVDVRVVTETSQEANCNGQVDGQDHVLSQADALTKNHLVIKYKAFQTHYMVITDGKGTYWKECVFLLLMILSLFLYFISVRGGQNYQYSLSKCSRRGGVIIKKQENFEQCPK